MIKKVLTVLSVILYFSGFTFAGFGIDIKGGKLFGSSSFGKYDAYYVIDGSKDYKTDFFYYGIDAFFEKK